MSENIVIGSHLPEPRTMYTRKLISYIRKIYYRQICRRSSRVTVLFVYSI